MYPPEEYHRRTKLVKTLRFRSTQEQVQFGLSLRKSLCSVIVVTRQRRSVNRTSRRNSDSPLRPCVEDITPSLDTNESLFACRETLEVPEDIRSLVVIPDPIGECLLFDVLDSWFSNVFNNLLRTIRPATVSSTPAIRTTSRSASVRASATCISTFRSRISHKSEEESVKEDKSEKCERKTNGRGVKQYRLNIPISFWNKGYPL